VKIARTSTLVFASLLCTAFGANAQTPSTTTTGATGSGYSLLPGTDRGYIGFNLGEARYGDGDDFGYKIFAGGRINPFLSVELGYVNFGDVSRFGGTAEAYGANLSLIGTVPVTEHVSLYGRLGTTYARTKQSAGTPGSPSGRENDFGISYGVGVGFNLTTNVQLIGEWERHRVDFAGGRENISLYTLGLRYMF